MNIDVVVISPSYAPTVAELPMLLGYHKGFRRLGPLTEYELQTHCIRGMNFTCVNIHDDELSEPDLVVIILTTGPEQRDEYYNKAIDRGVKTIAKWWQGLLYLVTHADDATTVCCIRKGTAENEEPVESTNKTLEELLEEELSALREPSPEEDTVSLPGEPSAHGTGDHGSSA